MPQELSQEEFLEGVTEPRNKELIRVFKVVAEEENLTKASGILHISQPAVTKHIKNLENELHVQLFKRSKYGMILNENGKEPRK